ncbi:MAG: tetratricopeptide repeat protein, partial [Thermodesulfobacteriota bacterium]|nr:tetratricopeptide repeat protein [Thermodesulfobacteriota bacterium]
MKVYNCKNKVTYLIIILFYMCFYSGFVFAQDKAKKAFERAKFEFEAENYDTALLMINKALEVDPENLEYKYYLALIYERTEKFRDAVSVFENLIKTSPEKYSKTYFQIAMIYAKLEENEQAMSYLKKAKKIDPKNASIYFNEGILFLKLMNYQEAIPLFEKAKQVDHNFSQIATFHIGLAYQRQKKYKMAKKLFKEAIEYAPETSIAKDCKQIISNIKGEKTGGRPWSIITSLSFQYDDNVYLDALEAADIRRYTGAASRDKSDFCTNFNFMGSYRLLKFNMWEAGFSYTNTQFIYNDLGDNNLIGNIGSIYTTFDRNPVWLKLHYEFSYYFATSDLEDKLRMNSIESILVLREKALFRTEIRALYQDMEFLDDTPDTYHVTIGITQFIPI